MHILLKTILRPRRWGALTLCCLVIMMRLLCAQALAMTAPGVAIENRAELIYVDAATGENVTVLSNLSQVSVAQYFDFTLLQDQRLTAEAGAELEFPHRLINTGNTPDSYQLTISDDAAVANSDEQSLPADGATLQADEVMSDDISSLQNYRIFEDKNGNGSVDAEDSELSVTGILAPAEALNIVVRATVPANAVPGSILSFRLQGASVGVATQVNDDNTPATLTRVVTDQVDVETGPLLVIAKQSSPVCEALLFPGDSVSHAIEVENTGSSAPRGIRHVLDGEVRNAVVVEQQVSEQFLFSHIDNLTTNGTTALAVVRLEGVAANSWISVDNWDGEARVASVGLWFESGELGASTGAAFTAELTAREVRADNAFYTSAATVDLDGDLLPDAESNNTCHRFTAPAAAGSVALRFLEPASEIRARGGIPDFATDDHFVDAIQYSLDLPDTNNYIASRDGVYLELNLSGVAAHSPLIDAAGNNYTIATVASEATGDTINVVLLETAVAGVFRSITPVRLSTDVRADNGYCPAVVDDSTVVVPDFNGLNSSCVLASGKGDQLQGMFVDATGVAVADVAIVNPQALVFNAQTLLPVEGALVSVVLAATDEIAADLISGALLQSVTDADGLYSLPRLQPDTDYYLRVEPPASHKFPSAVPIGALGGFDIRQQSYGLTGAPGGGTGVFRVAVDEVPDPVDIPVDSNVAERGVMVEKLASQTSIEPGQTVSYTLTVKNADEETYRDVTLEDRPPFGFRYVPGSTTQGEDAIVDPQIAEDGRLQFAIGDMAAADSITFRYALRATAGAIDSDGVNSAWATGTTADNAQFTSNVSRAKVSIHRDGVLSGRAALFGKIYVDQNCDGVQNESEWPIGGVKLYLQDGTYTISDADGLYSLYGLRPGSHVIKVDNHTMPEGLNLKLLDTNQGVDPQSRFVDLAEGDFYRVDFAAHCPSANVDDVFTEIRARNAALNGSWLLTSAEKFQADEQQLQRNVQADANVADGDLSHGVIDGPKDSEEKFNSALSMTVLQERASKQLAVEPKMPDPKKRVSSITQAQAKAGTWLWPLSELSVDGRFVVVVREGVDPTLNVNGKPVPVTQIGERLINRRERAQIVAWYGVELDAGENKLEVTGTDPFGNHRVLAQGVFKRPTSATQIRLTAAESTIQADGGRSSLPVKLELLDDNGLPALGVYFITLESSDGAFLEEDIQDSEQGRQIRVSNGGRTVNFISSEQTGPVTLRASTGEFADDLVIRQVSESRPLLATGFVEAGARFAAVESNGTDPTGNAFPSSGESDVDGRAALFIKGRVKDKYNLTLSYDSDKNSNETLLRDINPSLHYPIHGDASIRGYEAQSRSKLYVKIEEDTDSVMWGDYLTDTDTEESNLAISRRTLTGLSAGVTKGDNRFRVFAAMQDDPRVAEEFPGNGSAMLYRLESFPIIANSEVVEIITRSRDNPGIITGRTRLSRFGDYTIDPVEGFVSFTSVIPTLDDRQDPVYVRISYDVENGGDSYAVTGVRFDRQASEDLRFGLSATRDDHDEDGSQLLGAYARYKMATGTELFASIASSDTVRNGKGNAFRFTAEHRWRNGARTTFSHIHADREFTNFSAAVVAGRTETRVNHKQKVRGDASLLVDFVNSDSTATKESRTSLSALVESRFRQWLVRAGLRQVTRDDANADETFVTALIGADRRFVLGGRSGSVRAEYEQDTGLASRRRVTLGGKLQVHEKVRLYTNYELANSLLGLNGLSFDQRSESLTMGVESTVLPSTRVYSEYRMRGAFDGRDHVTATGIRGDYEIRKDLRVTPTFEVIRSVSEGDDSIAASISVTDTRNPNSRRLARLETRRTDTSDYIGLRASYAARINEDWTAVLTENLSRQSNTGTEDTLRHSLVAGLSRRPKLDNRHHMLLMYNWKEESGLGSGFDRSVHLLSTHQNLQLSNRALLSGRLGGKRQITKLDSGDLTDFALLADLRLNFDFNRRFNVDLRGGMLATDGASEMRFSAGAGVHYVINKNARIGVSYNFGGFRDEDLDHEEYNAHGFKVGVQFKFDEELFEWLQ
jgi:uncharacterized repeat protein (TIGR01451 family)